MNFVARCDQCGILESGDLEDVGDAVDEHEQFHDVQVQRVATDGGHGADGVIDSTMRNVSLPQGHSFVPIGRISPSERTFAAYTDSQRSQAPITRSPPADSFISHNERAASTFNPIASSAEIRHYWNTVLWRPVCADSTQSLSKPENSSGSDGGAR